MDINDQVDDDSSKNNVTAPASLGDKRNNEPRKTDVDEEKKENTEGAPSSPVKDLNNDIGKENERAVLTSPENDSNNNDDKGNEGADSSSPGVDSNNDDEKEKGSAVSSSPGEDSNNDEKEKEPADLSSPGEDSNNGNEKEKEPADLSSPGEDSNNGNEKEKGSAVSSSPGEDLNNDKKEKEPADSSSPGEDSNNGGKKEKEPADSSSPGEDLKNDDEKEKKRADSSSPGEDLKNDDEKEKKRADSSSPGEDLKNDDEKEKERAASTVEDLNSDHANSDYVAPVSHEDLKTGSMEEDRDKLQSSDGDAKHKQEDSNENPEEYPDLDHNNGIPITGNDDSLTSDSNNENARTPEEGLSRNIKEDKNILASVIQALLEHEKKLTSPVMMDVDGIENKNDQNTSSSQAEKEDLNNYSAERSEFKTDHSTVFGGENLEDAQNKTFDDDTDSLMQQTSQKNSTPENMDNFDSKDQTVMMEVDGIENENDQNTSSSQVEREDLNNYGTERSEFETDHSMACGGENPIDAENKNLNDGNDIVMQQTSQKNSIPENIDNYDSKDQTVMMEVDGIENENDQNTSSSQVEREDLNNYGTERSEFETDHSMACGGENPIDAENKNLNDGNDIVMQQTSQKNSIPENIDNYDSKDQTETYNALGGDGAKGQQSEDKIVNSNPNEESNKVIKITTSTLLDGDNEQEKQGDITHKNDLPNLQSHLPENNQQVSSQDDAFGKHCNNDFDEKHPSDRREQQTSISSIDATSALKDSDKESEEHLPAKQKTQSFELDSFHQNDKEMSTRIDDDQKVTESNNEEKFLKTKLEGRNNDPDEKEDTKIDSNDGKVINEILSLENNIEATNQISNMADGVGQDQNDISITSKAPDDSTGAEIEKMEVDTPVNKAVAAEIDECESHIKDKKQSKKPENVTVISSVSNPDDGAGEEQVIESVMPEQSELKIEESGTDITTSALIDDDESDERQNAPNDSTEEIKKVTGTDASTCESDKPGKIQDDQQSDIKPLTKRKSRTIFDYDSAADIGNENNSGDLKVVDKATDEVKHEIGKNEINVPQLKKIASKETYDLGKKSSDVKEPSESEDVDLKTNRDNTKDTAGDHDDTKKIAMTDSAGDTVRGMDQIESLSINEPATDESKGENNQKRGKKRKFLKGVKRTIRNTLKRKREEEDITTNEKDAQEINVPQLKKISSKETDDLGKKSSDVKEPSESEDVDLKTNRDVTKNTAGDHDTKKTAMTNSAGDTVRGMDQIESLPISDPAADESKGENNQKRGKKRKSFKGVKMTIRNTLKRKRKEEDITTNETDVKNERKTEKKKRNPLKKIYRKIKPKKENKIKTEATSHSNQEEDRGEQKKKQTSKDKKTNEKVEIEDKSVKDVKDKKGEKSKNSERKIEKSEKKKENPEDKQKTTKVKKSKKNKKK